MKKSRRKFIKQSSQFTLATGLSMWALSCGFSNSSNKNSKESFLEISRIFSNNMILQRDQPIPIWGWTNPNKIVELYFNDKKYRTVGNGLDGKWIFQLPPIPKNRSIEIQIKQGVHEINITNVLMGDVYLCSGQSNMEWPMKDVVNAEEEIAKANDPNIRHFKIPTTSMVNPNRNIIGGDWKISSPEEVKHFSATAYFFAKNIRQKYDVPIGLVNATQGSSHIKMWMRIEALDAKNKDEFLENSIMRRLEYLSKKYNYVPEVRKNWWSKRQQKKLVNSWLSLNYDDNDWINIQLPMQWGESDFMEMLGKIWYRKIFYLDDLTAVNSSVKINLGFINDSDKTFLNGEKIGETSKEFHKIRQYKVESTLLKKGKNLIAICIENFAGFGGISGGSNEMLLEIGKEKISLSGGWKMKIESLKYNKERLFETGIISSGLYNSLIHPLSNFPFRAILWYQGESNVVPNVQELFDYRFLFKKLITSWRESFKKPELPFIFAQLSSADTPCEEPCESFWARLRESQENALQLKNTEQIINLDSDNLDGTLHPTNKPELGRRYSLAVRKLVYGEEIIADGPKFKEAKRKGEYFYLYFSNVGKALLLKDGAEVKELAIAGKDQKFLWAKSRVEDDHIIVWHEDIEEPIAARYAWSNNPLKVNLYNSEGLPAGSFRTDDW